MPGLTDSGVSALLTRYETLKGERGAWEGVWRDAANFALPRKSNIYFQDSGPKKNPDRYSSAAIRANEKLAAGLLSYLCPSNQRWFELAVQQKFLKRNDNVKRWFEEATAITYEALAASNFNLHVHEYFLDLGVFGTAAMYAEKGDKTALNFQTFQMGTYTICENAQGLIDTVFREYELTARQALEMFGTRVHADISKDAEKPETMEKKYRFLHVVFPRTDRAPGKLDNVNMPFASVYIDMTHKTKIAEGGFRSNPFIVARFTKSPGQIWGQSPATTAEADIKVLNAMNKDTIEAADKRVNGAWLAGENALLRPLNTSKGQVNLWSANNPAGKPEPLPVPDDIGIGLEMIQAWEMVIKEAFFSDIFNLPEERPNMTATEVNRRFYDRLLFFSPVLGRLQAECFNPLIMRAVEILDSVGAFPELPPELMAYPGYKIIYSGKAALALKKMDSVSFAETFDVVAPFAELKPEILDNFDLDKIAQAVGHNNGMPNDWLRPEKDVAALRDARAKAQAQAAQLQTLQAAADAVPKLQGATDPASPLAALAKGVRNGRKAA